MSWGLDRTDAMFTIYVAYPAKDAWRGFQTACAAYGCYPVSLHTDQKEAREVAMGGVVNAPIPTHKKAELLAWMYGGFPGDELPDP